MLVSSILEAKGSAVATVPRTTPLAVVVTELVRHRIGALVVSPDGSAIDGIVSERDVVHRLSALRADLLDQPVYSVMSTDVVTCRPDDTVQSVMALMTDRRIRHVPVVAEGAMAGIISIGDLVKHRIDELERDRSELMEYITAR
jgi:CBS domain-containing protein